MRSHQGGLGLVDFGSDADMVHSQSVPIWWENSASLLLKSLFSHQTGPKIPQYLL